MSERWHYRVTWNGGHHDDYRDGMAAIRAMQDSAVPTTLTTYRLPADTCPGCPCGWTGAHGISEIRDQTGSGLDYEPVDVEAQP